MILCIFDRPGIFVWKSGNRVSLITVSIALLVWSFGDFFTTTNHFSEASVKYVGSSPITVGISSSHVLIPAFIDASGMLKMRTMPV